MSRYTAKATRGFTLIELLVVIAIIGVLAAVVLASLNIARTRANDAAIKANLGSIQVEAEVYYYNQNPNSYGTFSLSSGNCFVTGGAANQLFGQDATIKSALNAIKNITGSDPGSQLTCSTNAPGASGGPDYTVSAVLSDGTYWCIDSQAHSGVRAAGPISGGDHGC